MNQEQRAQLAEQALHIIAATYTSIPPRTRFQRFLANIFNDKYEDIAQDMAAHALRTLSNMNQEQKSPH